MTYLKVSEAAQKWGISDRRVRKLCAEERINGVIRKGNLYLIPDNAVRPADARTLTRHGVSPLLAELDQLKERLASMRPLSQGEVEALREEFMTSYAKVLDKEEKPVLDAIDQSRQRVIEVLETKEYAEEYWQRYTNQFAEIISEEDSNLSADEVKAQAKA